MALFIVDYYYYCGYDCGYSSGCGCLGFYYRVEGWVGHPSCTCPSPVMHLPGDDDERATPRTTRKIHVTFQLLLCDLTRSTRLAAICDAAFMYVCTCTVCSTSESVRMAACMYEGTD